MNPRYQVFVSSTYTDLIEERHAVREAILELAHFPAGMEIFPATDSTPWALIEQIITESDYYIVVIGGKYGSVDEEGISFTEREYDLADRLEKPILAFLHRDPDAIPAGKVERTSGAQKKLDVFRKKVLRRTCRFWNSPDDLKSLVLQSLIHAFRTQPQRGWIRAGGPDVTEILARLADLQQRHDELARENAALRARFGAPLSHDIAAGEELVGVAFSYTINPNEERKYSTKLSWNELFYGIAEELVTECEKDETVRALNHVVASAVWQTPLFDEMTKKKKLSNRGEFTRRIHISDHTLTTIMLQFIALGLVEASSVMRTRNDGGFGNQEYLVQVWKLTRSGLNAFLAKRVMRIKA